jgi:alpha-D-xyloside xylohydrolase
LSISLGRNTTEVRTKRLRFCRAVFLASISALAPISVPAATPEKVADGIIVPIGDRSLKIQVCAADIVRVACANDRAFFDRNSLAVIQNRTGPVSWSLKEDARSATLSTPKLQVRVDLRSGAVTFLDAGGKKILAEKPDGRVLTPAVVQGERTLHARQLWEPNDDESLYGLGQHQFGLMDIKGRDLDLWQRNTVIALPVLVSSRGHGILWDNTSHTRFGDLREPEPIPPAQLLDVKEKPGALTASYFADSQFARCVATRREERIDVAVPPNTPQQNLRLHLDLPPEGPVSVRWEGFIKPAESGAHTLWPFYNAGLRIWLDGELQVSHWRQGWLFWYDQARVHLKAGRKYRLTADWVVDQGEPTLKLLWKTPAKEDATALWSEVADGLDYYFIYGPQLDRVVAGYRQLTGQAPMMPRWALGFWQCRERYRTQQESLDVLDRFRTLGIPIDNIVQDWFYWRAPEWGSHEFDAERFPDPVGWIRTIHEKYNARLMISVWPKFHEGTRNFEELNANGFLYQPNLRERIEDWTDHRFTFYDAFNPAARKMFWAQMNRELFSKGPDAWWMDASEPEMRHAPMLEDIRHSIDRTAAGTASRVLLAYPLVNAQAVYEGQRSVAPDQRVFILTRSAYLGMQRCAAAAWSGDISSTWTAFQKQIPAGLSFCLSGIPYWTTDSGGFSVPPRWCRRDEKGAAPDQPIMSPEEADEWAEMNTRWLQFATFCPLMRVHGQFPFREMWEFGGADSPAFRAQLKFDRLRYRLLPYIYSLAGAVTHDGGTIMRALVMDFPADRTARVIGNQFMFGPALLVNPVTEYQARSREVYLPETVGWYDFWTGERLAGGKTLEAPAPYDAIPLFVKAGSILPVGPELQYTSEKPADPITLYVYAGADGSFTLYEDDGLTYSYERGEFARIPIRWNERRQTLTLGKREGSFPGMLAERAFNVIVVSGKKPTGFSFDPPAGRPVRYDGSAVEVRIK